MPSYSAYEILPVGDKETEHAEDNPGFPTESSLKTALRTFLVVFQLLANAQDGSHVWSQLRLRARHEKKVSDSSQRLWRTMWGGKRKKGEGAANSNKHQSAREQRRSNMLT